MISRLPLCLRKDGRKSATFRRVRCQVIAAAQRLCNLPLVGDVRSTPMSPTHHFRTPSPDGRQSFSTCRSSPFRGHVLHDTGGFQQATGKSLRVVQAMSPEGFSLGHLSAHSMHLSKEVFRWRAEQSVLQCLSHWDWPHVATRWANRRLSVGPWARAHPLSWKETLSQAWPSAQQATCFIVSDSPNVADPILAGSAPTNAWCAACCTQARGRIAAKNHAVTARHYAFGPRGARPLSAFFKTSDVTNPAQGFAFRAFS